ncbi:MAG: hypothetical protein MAG794_00133 [Gammaproteobacteria bacterium]|nr:hypothetical protein [Gammaproteobacteria bacterium]
MIRYVLSFLVILSWIPAVAAQVTLDAVPGGLVEIPLLSREQPRPKAFFGQKRILVMEFGRQWVGLVGLPLSLVPGRYLIQARLDGQEEPIVREFRVYPRRIHEKPMLQDPEAMLDFAAIDFTWRDTLDAKLPLDSPVARPARPIFGRYEQNPESASSYVNFVAFRIDSDTSITAPDKGRVAATETHESGTFIWIDHGMGLYTLIGPMSRTKNDFTDSLEAGERIGDVLVDDAQSRSLYWSVFLNGTAIDPFLIANIDKDSLRDISRINPGLNKPALDVVTDADPPALLRIFQPRRRTRTRRHGSSRICCPGARFRDRHPGSRRE